MKKRYVIKRDGAKEKFNTNKIERVVLAAGLDEKQANKLVRIITKWVYMQKEDSITSLRIRDKVIEEIQKIDRYAADLYIWYQKTLDRDNKN
jgi:transcriptional regulator NrdR family protein